MSDSFNHYLKELQQQQKADPNSRQSMTDLERNLLDFINLVGSVEVEKLIETSRAEYGLTLSMTTKIIEKLEKMGQISLQSDPDSKSRKKIVEITDRGRERLERGD